MIDGNLAVVDSAHIGSSTKPGTFNSTTARSAVVRRNALVTARSELMRAGSTIDRTKETKIRGYLTLALLKHAQALAKSKHKLDLKQTVETASELFGWGKNTAPGTLLQIGMVEKLDVRTPQ